jgi:hypothetical protein
MGERERGAQVSKSKRMGTGEAPCKTNRSRAAEREEPAEGKIVVQIIGQVGSERANDGIGLPKDVSP